MLTQILFFFDLPWTLLHLIVFFRPKKDESVSLLKIWFLRVLAAHVTGSRWDNPARKAARAWGGADKALTVSKAAVGF